MMDSPASPILPNGSVANFAPRKEFVKDQHTFSTFALLTLAGPGLVRLYSFPPPLIATLRAFLEHRKLLENVREVGPQTLCEFALDGRPWATAKSVKSEKLLIEILTIIFRHGYNFLSTIDYGREQDDRLAIAFSRPTPTPASRSGSPAPGMPSSVSAAPAQPSARTFRVPVGISFFSPTCLRVINPPLSSTPAILQAVRGAWPRGVMAEKKVADTSFEFKLKGYRWFQEDTFATDSLQHILSLLASLDSHGFTLLTSLSLANRSRIKDLWLFIGPATESPVFPETPPGTPAGSSVELRRQAQQSGMSHLGSTGSESQLSPRSPYDAGSSHSRLGTNATITPFPLPFPNSPSSPQGGHMRSRSEAVMPSSSRSPPPAPAARAVLRKNARMSTGNPEHSPHRIQVELPGGLSRTEEESLVRADLASEVGSVNMTGVGAGRSDRGYQEDMYADSRHSASVFYSTSGYQPPLRPTSEELQEDEISRNSSPETGRTSSGTGHEEIMQAGIRDKSRSVSPARAESTMTTTPPLLGPTAFRDTSFSSGTWVGQDVRHSDEIAMHTPDTGMRPGMSAYLSQGPSIPGAWQPTPKEERPRNLTPSPVPVEGPLGMHVRGYHDGAACGYHDGAASEQRGLPYHGPPEQKVMNARTVSPSMIQMDGARKSEAGLIGALSGNSSPERKQSDGWIVLTNQEGSSPPRHSREVSGARPVMSRPRSSSDPGSLVRGRQDTEPAGSPPAVRPSTPSPLARNVMTPEVMHEPESSGESSSSGFRRLFSKSDKPEHGPKGVVNSKQQKGGREKAKNGGLRGVFR